ncbi:MAG: DUF2934 domain-containing protein [Terracidiphilus sp.]
MIVSKVQKRSEVKTSPASKSGAPEISASKDSIRKRPFDIYESRGSEPGNDLHDWLHAERPILER